MVNFIWVRTFRRRAWSPAWHSPWNRPWSLRRSARVYNTQHCMVLRLCVSLSPCLCVCLWVCVYVHVVVKVTSWCCRIDVIAYVLRHLNTRYINKLLLVVTVLLLLLLLLLLLFLSFCLTGIFSGIHWKWAPIYPKVTYRRTFEGCWCEVFPGRMPFMSPNQQCHRTEGRFRQHAQTLPTYSTT